jgi:hypothetical protein
MIGLHFQYTPFGYFEKAILADDRNLGALA